MQTFRISMEMVNECLLLLLHVTPFVITICNESFLNCLVGILTQFQVCGISLTDNVVEVIFHIFDFNQDGNLSSKEFVRALRRRENDIANPEGDGLMGLLSCCHNCGNQYTIERLLS